MSIAGLQAALAAKPEGTEPKQEPVEVKTGKKYQFPSAPTSFMFPWKSHKDIFPEGVYYTEDKKEIEYLDECVRVGCISDFVVFAEKDKPVQLKLPTPQVGN